MISFIFDLFILSFMLGIPIALIAYSKGFNPILWFVYGFFLWIIALVHVIVAPRTEYAEGLKRGTRGEHKCPYCGEFINKSAKLCIHCSNPLDPFKATHPSEEYAHFTPQSVADDIEEVARDHEKDGKYGSYSQIELDVRRFYERQKRESMKYMEAKGLSCELSKSGNYMLIKPRDEFYKNV